MILCRESTVRGNAVTLKGDYQVVYRSVSEYGRIFGQCGLPFILETLSEEIENLHELSMQTPEELLNPSETRFERTEELEKEIEELKAKIETAEENLMFSEDPRTRQSLDKKISEMRGPPVDSVRDSRFAIFSLAAAQPIFVPGGFCPSR